MCLLVKSKGKPDAGNPPVRFDEGEGASLPTLLSSVVSLSSDPLFVTEFIKLRPHIENPPSLVSRYSSIPSVAPSRPNPLSFIPPKGAAADVGLISLIPTMPK